MSICSSAFIISPIPVMRTLLCLISLLIILTPAATTPAAAISSATHVISWSQEAEALLTFKDAITNDPGSCLSSWSLDNSTMPSNTSIQCSSSPWHGVSCDARSHVISLNLSHCNLAGSIPPNSLGLLSSLSVLDLSYNNLSGSIPPSLGLLSSLSVLDLSYNNLSGSIPPSLGLLSSLSHLDLSDNSFSGVLSPSLFPRPNSSLAYLRLGHNPHLSGPIPQSLPLHSPNLQSLFLFNTSLSGVVPPALWTHLPALRSLIIGSNPDDSPPSLLDISFPANGSKFAFCDTIEVLRLSNLHAPGASFPSSLGDCLQLQTLELVYISGLHGSIPMPIWQLPHLQNLIIQADPSVSRAPYNLTWSWPSTFGFCTPAASSSITEIYISGIGLTGNIPASMEACAASLHTLNICDTSLEGPIPSFLGNLTQLRSLGILNNNLITGTIPDALGKLRNLRWLQLTGNSLTGSIPTALGGLADLRYLDLSINNLTGPVPVHALHNLTSILTLRLSKNHLSGKIETLNLSKLPQLQNLEVYGNTFGGGLPIGLPEHQELVYIFLQGNQFLTGPLGDTTAMTAPFTTGLSKLRVLSVSYNRLNGDIPAWLWHLPRLQILDLSNNRFTGHLPATLTGLSYLCMTNQTAGAEMLGADNDQFPIMIKNTIYVLISLQNLRTSIDVSMNMLVGAIPESFGELQGLIGVNLSHNQFSGMIPEHTFGRLKSLEVLDLSHNQLSGEIPADLGFLSLSVLDLSDNRLQGRIPAQNNINTRYTASAFDDNPGLCGLPLPDCSPTNAYIAATLKKQQFGIWIWFREFTSPWSFLIAYPIGLALGAYIYIFVCPPLLKPDVEGSRNSHCSYM